MLSALGILNLVNRACCDQRIQERLNKLTLTQVMRCNSFEVTFFMLRDKKRGVRSVARKSTLVYSSV